MVALATPVAKPAPQPQAQPAAPATVHPATVDKAPVAQPVAMASPSLALPRTFAASSETQVSYRGPAFSSSDDR